VPVAVEPERTFCEPATFSYFACGGLLSTGLVDGSFAAYDDTSLEQLWEINVGSGFNAPPMTFEVGGKQYVAILTGLGRNAKAALVNTPELREMRHQTMLFVFRL
jgi:alcohol dehydrogenase (cytochrome c)